MKMIAPTKRMSPDDNRPFCCGRFMHRTIKRIEKTTRSTIIRYRCPECRSRAVWTELPLPGGLLR